MIFGEDVKRFSRERTVFATNGAGITADPNVKNEAGALGFSPACKNHNLTPQRSKKKTKQNKKTLRIRDFPWIHEAYVAGQATTPKSG